MMEPPKKLIPKHVQQLSLWLKAFRIGAIDWPPSNNFGIDWGIFQLVGNSHAVLVEQFEHSSRLVGWTPARTEVSDHRLWAQTTTGHSSSTIRPFLRSFHTPPFSKMTTHFHTPNIPKSTKNNHQQWMISIKCEAHALGLANAIVDQIQTSHQMSSWSDLFTPYRINCQLNTGRHDSLITGECTAEPSPNPPKSTRKIQQHLWSWPHHIGTYTAEHMALSD